MEKRGTTPVGRNGNASEGISDIKLRMAYEQRQVNLIHSVILFCFARGNGRGDTRPLDRVSFALIVRFRILNKELFHIIDLKEKKMKNMKT